VSTRSGYFSSSSIASFRDISSSDSVFSGSAGFYFSGIATEAGSFSIEILYSILGISTTVG
jgi:hypothetical protein